MSGLFTTGPAAGPVAGRASGHASGPALYRLKNALNKITLFHYQMDFKGLTKSLKIHRKDGCIDKQVPHFSLPSCLGPM